MMMVHRMKDFPKVDADSWLTEDYTLESVQDVIGQHPSQHARLIRHMEEWFQTLNETQADNIRKSGVRHFLEKLLYLLRHANNEGVDFWFGRTMYSESRRWRAVAYQFGGNEPSRDSILASRPHRTFWTKLQPEYVEVLGDMLSILDDYIGRD
jgi:hypothetical protein